MPRLQSRLMRPDQPNSVSEQAGMLRGLSPFGKALLFVSFLVFFFVDFVPAVHGAAAIVLLLLLYVRKQRQAAILLLVAAMIFGSITLLRKLIGNAADDTDALRYTLLLFISLGAGVMYAAIADHQDILRGWGLDTQKLGIRVAMLAAIQSLQPIQYEVAAGMLGVRARGLVRITPGNRISGATRALKALTVVVIVSVFDIARQVTTVYTVRGGFRVRRLDYVDRRRWGIGDCVVLLWFGASIGLTAL
jgi:hypothetical protein